MSRLSWAKAKQTLAGLFAEWPDQWPQRLAPVHLARLQAPPNGKDRSLTRAFDEAISAACAAGELAHEKAAFVFPPLVAWASLEDRPGEGAARWRAQCTTESLPAVTAGDFVAWLHKQGETPSGHVAAWVEATGGAEVPVPGVVAAAKIAKATQAEERVNREDARLGECEAKGMVFDKASLLRLPDGIGEVALGLGITRQSLTTDVKAALRRRFETARNGPA